MKINVSNNLIYKLVFILALVVGLFAISGFVGVVAQNSPDVSDSIECDALCALDKKYNIKEYTTESENLYATYDIGAYESKVNALYQELESLDSQYNIQAYNAEAEALESQQNVDAYNAEAEELESQSNGKRV